MRNLHLSLSVSFDQVMELVRQLSPADKNKLREQLSKEDAAISSEHQETVNTRRLKSKSDSSRMLDWNEVSKVL